MPFRHSSKTISLHSRHSSSRHSSSRHSSRHSSSRTLLTMLLLLLTFAHLSSCTSTTSGRRTKIQPNEPKQQQQNEPKEQSSSDHVQNSSISDRSGGSGSGDGGDDDGYWLEVKAIIGGVLGFWGGVVGLGAVFLVVVVSQRYCCKKRDRDDKDGTQ